ncbi:cytochrome P450 CYP736A12-like [Abrus precatorius]|uniref:Cytochrome P450 CYP736A12-like n=1 Tax=Abrus precatorius TaxID=3816 RepID=A0A8B8MJ87_ABRPR|nr:cytochrome P450 CYP736A12-like [Abrus precatorius]
MQFELSQIDWMIWIIIFLLSLAYLWLWKSKKKAKKLPPGPKGLPILGSLHMLGANPHRDLHQLAQKHGPVMYLRLGFVPTIVVSTPQAAELFLKTHDHVFASRPPHEAAKYISWEQRSLSFSEYGSYWRNMRKMCTLELLSQTKINTFRCMREEELDLLIKILREDANDGAAVDVSAKVATFSADIACRMILGKKYMDKEFDEKGFKGVMQEGMHLAATPNIGDYIPYIGALDLQGLTKRMKAVRKIFDNFFDKIIVEHMQSDKGGQDKIKDFVDVMLGFVGTEESEYRVERPNIKAVLLDMLAGSMDTSATAIEWTLSELIKNPRVMKKVQMELERVVGMKRKVEESDLEKLEYLNMVIKESMRIHPVAPLLIPRQSMEDCMVGEFFIPKKSRVIINAWAIMREPSAWSEAEKFWPERFEGSNNDVRGHDFQLIPFGSGRRGCPGLQLGLTVVRLVVAQLVHCFHWKLPHGMLPNDLDMTEHFGLAMPRANHLVAVPTYRLHDEMD